ncbi:ribonuclease J, partial [Trifolium medium]|nr:ribonuclease J [Trifolium medium]
MVRKYSGKRPEVIAIATENPGAVFADEINKKLSGKSHVGPGIPTLRKKVDEHRKENQSTKLQTRVGSCEAFGQDIRGLLTRSHKK